MPALEDEAILHEKINDEVDDDDQSESDTSSEHDELENDAKDDAEVDRYPWRKGKLSTAQYSLAKVERLFTGEARAIISKSEQSLDQALKQLLETVSSAKIDVNDPCLETGKNILKTLCLINKISENFIISLKRPDVTNFFGSVFQYLQTIPKSPAMCLRILRHLGRVHFDCINHSKIEEVITTPEYLNFILDEILESSVVTNNDLLACKEPLRLCYKLMLGIISRVKNVFAKHFDLLRQTMHKKSLDLHTVIGANFRRYIVPYKKLEPKDLDFMAHEIRCLQNTDSKLPTEQIVSVYCNLMKNKHFRPNQAEFDRLVTDVHSLAGSMAHKSAHSQTTMVHNVGSLLSNMIFKSNLSESEQQMAVNVTTGFFDTIVDDLHPKSTVMVKKLYYQSLVKFFLTHYVREAKKCKRKTPEFYERIRASVHPILKKVMNFSLFDRFYATSYEKGLMSLCHLDKDVFAEYLLNKIRFAFEFEEFRKADVIKILDVVSGIFIKDEKLSEHLIWIIPKVLQQLDKCAEGSSVTAIAALLSTIFENFVGLDDLKEKSHLCRMRDDIDQAAMMFFEFYVKKADNYGIQEDALKIILSLSDFTKRKCKEQMLDFINGGFEKFSKDNTENMIKAGYEYFAEDIEKALVSWLDNKVFTKVENYSIDSLTLGSCLRKLGLPEQIDVKIGSDNQSTLKNYAKVLAVVAEISSRVSEPLLHKSMLALSILVDNDSHDVSKEGTAGLTSIFKLLDPYVPKPISNAKVEETTEKDKGCCAFVWRFPEIEQKERVELLTKSFIFEPFAVAHKLLHSGLNTTSRQVDDCYIVQLYKDTLAQKQDGDAKETEISTKAICRLNEVLRLISDSFNHRWVRNNYLKSAKLQYLVESLKEISLKYYSNTGNFSNARLRSKFTNLLFINLRSANLALTGEDKYSLYMRAMRGYFSYFDMMDSSVKSTLMELVLENHLAVYKYFHGKELLDFDSIETGTDADTRSIAIESNSLWLFGGDLESRFIQKDIEEIMKHSILYSVDGGQSVLQKQVNQHLNRWISIEESLIQSDLLHNMHSILDIEQANSEKYSQTSTHIQEAIYTFLSKKYIKQQNTKESLLDLAVKIAHKSDFKKVHTIFFQFTNYLLLTEAVEKDSKWSNELESNIQRLYDSEDETLTLADMVALLMKIVMTYPQWTDKIRAFYARALIIKLNTKNINKRIVLMSMIFFLLRLTRASDFEKINILLDNTAFLNENKVMSLERTIEAFAEIKKQIGLSEQGSQKLNDAEMAEISKLSPQMFPADQSTQYLELPFEVQAYHQISDTSKEFSVLIADDKVSSMIEDSIIQYLKVVIMEYTDSVEETNLFVKYSYVERLVLVQKSNSVNRESLIFASLRLISSFFGYRKMRDIIKRLEGEVIEKNADFVKVTLIIWCTMLASNQYYSNEDFNDLLSYTKQILKPMMNAINFKRLQELIPYVYVVLKLNFSFERLRAFWDAIIDLKNEDLAENKGYYIEILVLQPTTGSLILYDRLIDDFQKTAKDLDTSQLSNVRSISKFYGTILSVRYLQSLGLEYSAGQADSLKGVELTKIALENPDLMTRDFIEFIQKVKNCNVITRMECLKVLMTMLRIKSIDSQNFDVTKESLALIFTLDPNEDPSMTQLVGATHKMIDGIRHHLDFTEETKEDILRYLNQTYDELKSVDCLKSLIKLIRRGIGSRISSDLEEIMLKISRDSRIPLRDSIDSLYRHDVFSRLSNEVIYGYADKIFSKIDAIVKEK